MYYLKGDFPKSIETLVEDIYSLFSDKEKEEIPREEIISLGDRIAECVQSRLYEKRETYLRLSNFGVPCSRQLWLKINRPEVVESLKPETQLMFLIGDIVEHVLIFLARQSGHTVTGEQDTVSIGGIEGHRDCIIDGHLVDVKSASPFSFDKFKFHALRGNDPFGYVDQLGAYLAATEGDPLVVDKGKASFLAVNKVSGEIVLDTHDYVPGTDEYADLAFETAGMLLGPMPDRAFSEVPIGKSGNMGLGTECKYCQVKSECFVGLRCFEYSNGDVYLTKVIETPKVPERKM